VQLTALRVLTRILRPLKPQLNPAKLKVSGVVWSGQKYSSQLPESRPGPTPGLKIAIPEDASKPDGDAVENGALLSASELHARGHFVNSPSDLEPTFAGITKDNNDNVKDKSYRPPKCSDALDDDAPKRIYTSDGEEVTSETEQGQALVRT
jgi:hypothetical protein